MISPSTGPALRRIAQRCDDSDAGDFSRTSEVRGRGDLNAELPAMRLIGYRQLWNHLEGGCSLEAAVYKAVAATRQLARRQLTWLRAEPGAEWFDSLDPATPERISRRVAEWLRKR